MGLENFASPGLRWGLLLVDHPGATHEFKLLPGTEIGFPKQFGGEKDFCVCTITFPEQDGEQRAPVSGNKEAKILKGEPDEWVVICTKTLGRALKKAGYPDDLEDLKDLMLWRKQNAQVTAVMTGKPMVPLSRPSIAGLQESSAQVEAALEVAAELSPAHLQAVPDIEPVNQEFLEHIRAAVNELDGETRVALREFLDNDNIPAQSKDWSNSDLAAIEDWLNTPAPS